MIKIAGLGISGLYIYTRLKNSGFDVSAFELKKPDHYIPCGFATNINIIKKYADNINIDFDKYVMSYAKDITFSGNNFAGRHLASKGLVTFDKNKFENDIIKSINYEKSIIKTENRDNIIIDATGISRYYIKQTTGDDKYYTIEYLTENSDFKDFYFYFLPQGRGYFWSFPLGNGRYHVGVGSKNMQDLSMINKYKRIRITGRNIRMKPLFSAISNDNIIGIGEAIGTVSPLTGEGIIPSLKSAEILFQAFKKYNDLESLKDEYERNIKKEFYYYNILYRFVKNVQENRIINYNTLKANKIYLKI
uniref:NAD(P)/FAD-dependent oxidoreductase n=1 Tax=Acidiplasma cupricumulans TaxID=312540 RepID=UPI000780AD78